MQHTARNSEINKLKLRGFKVIPKHRNYYINKSGDIVNLKTGNLLKNYPRNEHVKIEGKTLNISKLVLLTFAKQPYREKQHIEYKDKDKTNFHISNVKYQRFFRTTGEPINKTDLLTAIRCYIEVKKSLRPENTLIIKMYLGIIFQKRQKYIIKNQYIINIYSEYLKNSIAKTAQKYKLSVRDCTLITNTITNKLINSTLTDLKAGKLELLPFLPRKKTFKQIYKEYQEHAKEIFKKLDTD